MPFLFPEYIINTCFFVGLVYIIRKLSVFIYDIIYLSFCKPYDFKKRYGKQTWVIITGSTDGIGKEFALYFAQLKDFNIIQVARNQQKMQSVEQELLQLNPQLKTKQILADFTQGNSENFYENIKNQIQGLNISILINNVGIGEFNKIDQYSHSMLQDMITVNINSQVFMTKIVTPFLKEHTVQNQNKAAIINISSFASKLLKPYGQIYSGTKTFNLAFSICMEKELREHKIDVLAACPSMVATKILAAGDKKDLEKAKKLMITTQQFVYSVAQQLGRVNQTRGHLKHKIIQYIMEIIPYCDMISGKIMYNSQQKKKAQMNKTK